MIKPEETKLYLIIGENVKRYKKELCYKQSELAEILGISYTTFSHKINNCGEHFNILELKKLADEFMVTVDELMTKGE